MRPVKSNERGRETVFEEGAESRRNYKIIKRKLRNVRIR